MSGLMLTMMAGATAVIYPPAPRGTFYVDYTGTTCTGERQKSLAVSLGDGGPLECNLLFDAANVIDLTVAGTTCVKQIHDRITGNAAVVTQARCAIGQCCYLPGTAKFFRTSHNTASCATTTQTPLTLTVYTDNTCTTVDDTLNLAPGLGGCQRATNTALSAYHLAFDKTPAQICQLFAIATTLEIAGTAYTTNYYQGAGCTGGANLVAAGNLVSSFSLSWNSLSPSRRTPNGGLVPIARTACGTGYSPCTGCCRLYDRSTCSYVAGLHERITRSCNNNTLLVIRRQVFLDETCDQLHTAYPGYDETTTIDNQQTCSATTYNLQQRPTNVAATTAILSYNGRWEATQAIVPGNTDFCVAARISRGYSDLLVDDAAAAAITQAARDRMTPIPTKYNAGAPLAASAVFLISALLSVLL